MKTIFVALTSLFLACAAQAGSRIIPANPVFVAATNHGRLERIGQGDDDHAEVQLAYAIGVAEPVSVLVDTFGTGRVPEQAIERAVREVFPLTPKGIIEHLDLRKPVYRRTAAYGHFGRFEPGFTWETTDHAEALSRGVKA